MTILVTGSGGKTARNLTAQLQAAGHTVLVASRSAAADDPARVRFDWLDASTHTAPFAHPAAAASPIKAAYLVLPLADDAMCAAALSFVATARARGVRRFVLLSSSAVAEGGPFMGVVHAGLRAASVEWAVLRPSWFMGAFLETKRGWADVDAENFSEHGHAATIRDAGKIFSATETGRVPFVSAEDIAAVAAAALTEDVPRNGEYLVLGPELLAYDDVARILGEELGRDVTHVSVSPEELVGMLVRQGVIEDYAAPLVAMDVQIAGGSEERLGDDVERATGRKPLAFRDFVRRNKAAWE
jgi:festuclavine dehydrogenase